MCIPILSLDLYGMDLPVNGLVARFEGPLGRIVRVASLLLCLEPILTK